MYIYIQSNKAALCHIIIVWSYLLYSGMMHQGLYVCIYIERAALNICYIILNAFHAIICFLFITSGYIYDVNFCKVNYVIIVY